MDEIHAFIFIKLAAGFDYGTIKQQIESIKNVEYMYLLYGPSDGIVSVKAENWGSLNATIFEISQIRDVVSTDTRIVA